jgi:hypothetical protein
LVQPFPRTNAGWFRYLAARLIASADLLFNRLALVPLLGFGFVDYVTIPSRYAFDSRPERFAPDFFQSLDAELSRLPGPAERLLFSPALFANPR